MESPLLEFCVTEQKLNNLLTFQERKDRGNNQISQTFCCNSHTHESNLKLLEINQILFYYLSPCFHFIRKVLWNDTLFCSVSAFFSSYLLVKPMSVPFYGIYRIKCCLILESQIKSVKNFKFLFCLLTIGIL
jgi:hypothetical protein